MDAAGEFEFAQDVLHVNFDGGLGQIEAAGDDFVAVAGGEVAEHFEFAGGEFVEAVFFYRLGGFDQRLHHVGHHFGGEDVVAFGGVADGFGEEVGVDVFEQEAVRSEAHAFEQVVAVFGYGEHDDALLWAHAEDLGEGFAAVHDGHVEVEQDDVGVGLAHGFDAGEAV